MPWETCMPMGTSWSWIPNEQYKPTAEIVRTLAQVVTRGGSLLLNIGPRPDGQFDSTAYVRLHEVGAWLKVNGEAVYGTRAADLDAQGAIGCTRRKDDKAIYLFGEAGDAPWSIAWHGDRLPKATLLGSGRKLRVKQDRERLEVHVKEAARANAKRGIYVVKLLL